MHEDELATFRVRIDNQGLLDMTGVTLRVVANSGATLRIPLDVPLQGGRAARVVAMSWVDELVTQAIDVIPANGGTATTESLTLKAPSGLVR